MSKLSLPVHADAPKFESNGKSDANGKAANSEASPQGALDRPQTSSPFVSGAAYCVVSASMVLMNKYALSGFDFTCPNTLLLAQCIASVLIVKGGELVGVWRLEPLRWQVIRVRALAGFQASRAVYPMALQHCVVYMPFARLKAVYSAHIMCATDNPHLRMFA